MNPVIFVDLKYVPEPKARKLIPGRSRWQPWRAVILAEGNHEPLFRSSERWTNRQDALDAISLGFGPDTIVYLREAEKGNVLLRHPDPWPAA
jgi:hypothetical protein